MPVLAPQPVRIATDGACKNNPGPGGWAAILQAGAHEKTLMGAALSTTNNRMELTAVIMALRPLKRPSAVTILTDSRYVIDGFTQWLPAWKARNWRTSSKKPVLNEDLWRALEQAALPHCIHWQWVKGHSGHPLNERADRMANQAIQTMLNPL